MLPTYVGIKKTIIRNPNGWLKHQLANVGGQSWKCLRLLSALALSRPTLHMEDFRRKVGSKHVLQRYVKFVKCMLELPPIQ